MNPYVDNEDIRTFSESVDEMELIWHRDRADRKITILEGRDWKLQMDNKLPIQLIENHTYDIPKMTYHRIIKGIGNLVLRIKNVTD